MRVLGIDTHGPIGGAALIADGALLSQVLLSVRATHSEQLLPSIQSVLAGVPEADRQVDAISVALGPGSFTGLRIGVVTAKSLAYAWNIPLIGVNTLEAIAYQSRCVGPIQVGMVSSRRDRVFAGAYRLAAAPAYVPVEPVIEPGHYQAEAFIEAVAQLGERVVLAGDAVAAFRELIERYMGEQAIAIPPVWERLHAASIAHLGEILLERGQECEPHALVPEYLRKAEAEIRWETKFKS